MLESTCTGVYWYVVIKIVGPCDIWQPIQRCISAWRQWFTYITLIKFICIGFVLGYLISTISDTELWAVFSVIIKMVTLSRPSHPFAPVQVKGYFVTDQFNSDISCTDYYCLCYTVQCTLSNLCSPKLMRWLKNFKWI